jgi:hypothetical protein
VEEIASLFLPSRYMHPNTERDFRKKIDGAEKYPLPRRN